MSFTIWALIIGIRLITTALSGTLLKRLPVSTGMLYLAAGYALGPAGWDLMAPHRLEDAAILERMAEVTVLISPFRSEAGSTVVAPALVSAGSPGLCVHGADHCTDRGGRPVRVRTLSARS